MSYLCRKGLNIYGVAYKPGDVIPCGVILPNRVRTLTAVGMISEVAENTETPVVNSQPVASVPELSTITIPVKGENGDITLNVTPDEVQEVFSLLQMTANEGIAAIGKIKSDNVLILIHATDTRKTVQNAAKERADILSYAESNKNALNGSNEATDYGENGNHQSE